MLLLASGAQPRALSPLHMGPGPLLRSSGLGTRFNSRGVSLRSVTSVFCARCEVLSKTWDSLLLDRYEVSQIKNNQYQCFSGLVASQKMVEYAISTH